MVYTKKSPALLIIGLLILLWGWLNTTTTIDGLQAWLHPSAAADHQKVAKKYQDDQKAAEKAKAEGKEAPAVKKGSSRLDSLKADQARLATIFGGILTVLGLLVFALPSREGDLDYYLSVFPGIAFILIIALIVRWVLDPMFANWGRAVMDAKILTWNFASIFNLNYVVLGIVIGIITVNVFKIPDWAANGVRTARFFLKTGVILLGTLYSAAELAQLGALSVVMIGVFVLGSVWLVLIMGRRMDAGNSMTGFSPRAWACAGYPPRSPRRRWCRRARWRSPTRSAPSCSGAWAACSSSRRSGSCSAWGRCSSARGPEPASSTPRRWRAPRWRSTPRASRR